MPIIIPEASDSFRDSVATGTRAARTVSAMAGEDVTVSLTPHRIYTIDLTDLVASKGIGAARLLGWRVFHAADHDAVIESYCDENDEDHHFGGVNRGPYVGGTRRALEVAAAHPRVAEEDFEVRLLRLPGIHVSALWLHGTPPEAQLLIPMEPLFSDHDTGTAYPADQFLDDLRPLAEQALADGTNRG